MFATQRSQKDIWRPRFTNAAPSPPSTAAGTGTPVTHQSPASLESRNSRQFYRTPSAQQSMPPLVRASRDNDELADKLQVLERKLGQLLATSNNGTSGQGRKEKRQPKELTV
uniref:Uncharacterized protein n=1 Tax=Amphimedon queenslandica TaxID=400682 RepID=A0A1X7U7R1_AMPQE